MVKAFVHPAFDGIGHGGFDYAIGILGPPLGGTRNSKMPEATYDDFFVATVSEQNIDRIIGKQIQNVGFPSMWKGVMTYHDGPCLGYYSSHRMDYNGRSYKMDIDATPGNSGGPVFTRDPAFVSFLRTEVVQNYDGDDD